MGNWLKKIGIASVFAFPLAVVLTRLGVLPFRTSFMLLQVGLVVGVIVFVVGIIYFLLQRKSNNSGAKAALVGAVIAIIPVLPLMLQAKKAKSLPFIHNVSTDIQNAPKFDKVLALRTAQDNPHQYDANQAIGESGTLGALQRNAYPNVKTHVSDMSAEDALARAQSVVDELGWELVDVNADNGIIEATDTTLLWGFKDDVAIRVSSRGGQTLVDLHSVSRFGGSDIGANAARIEKFLAVFSK